VFELKPRSECQMRIDLDSVRETLLYIESDLRHAPGYETVAAAISAVLDEIERVEGEAGKDKAPNVIAAQFVPARF
jgi:hypothetical protein